MESGIFEHLDIVRRFQVFEFFCFREGGVRCASVANYVEFLSSEYLFRNGLSDAGD